MGRTLHRAGAGGLVRAAGLFLACASAGCGGGAASAPAASLTGASSAADASPETATSRFHPIDPAAFGLLYGSGCPVNGACDCGNSTDPAEEFNCQLDHLVANDIPVTAYLFDGSAWSLGRSTPDAPCTGPGCCAWKLGDQVIARMAQGMFENPDRPVLSGGPMTYSFLVGDEIFVPIVTDRTDSMDLQLPAGQWIDFRDDSRLVSGTLASYPAPLGREPIFVRQGSLVPLEVRRDLTGHGTVESAGSLTVLVYPSGTSSFRYRDALRQSWTTLTSSLSGDVLTLTVDPALPGRPLI